MSVALSITGLTKTYANGFEALKGIDLEVERGDFFALLGPNGAGKSTTIGIISSLVNKSSGKVLIFGRDIDTDFSQARTNLGLVPQEFNFNMFEPVEEIIINQAGYYGIARPLAVDRTNHFLKLLGLWEKRHYMARELSGGTKRRLMIARALVHNPKLLILDEPTAGVDIEIRHSMWEFLTKINAQGTTIILTTHYLEEAENLCRNIAIINRGELIENTSMKQLLGKLQSERLLLDLAEPVGKLPETLHYPACLLDDHTMEVEITRESDINSLFRDLGENGIVVKSMRNKTNRLEQLFMSLLQSNGDGS